VQESLNDESNVLLDALAVALADFLCRRGRRVASCELVRQQALEVGHALHEEFASFEVQGLDLAGVFGTTVCGLRGGHRAGLVQHGVDLFLQLHQCPS
jgi:hypothetical protein